MGKTAWILIAALLIAVSVPALALAADTPGGRCAAAQGPAMTSAAELCARPTAEQPETSAIGPTGPGFVRVSPSEESDLFFLSQMKVRAIH